MSRIDDIIERARDTLNDAAGTRWTTARLLRLIDEGQKEIVRQTNMLRAKTTIQLFPGVALYSTPSDCYSIIRVLHNGVKIDLKSHEEMDDLAGRDQLSVGTDEDDWETAEGFFNKNGDTIDYIIYDKLNPGKIKTYPIPAGEEGSMELEGSGSLGLVITAAGLDYSTSSIYGIIRDIDNLSSINDENVSYNTDPLVSGLYGFPVFIDDNTDDITLYYLKRANKITATSDLLEIDAIWDTCLKYYVTGHALRDDKDTQNRQVGNEELSLYRESLDEAKLLASQDFNKVRTHYDSPYVSGFGTGGGSDYRLTRRTTIY